MKLYSLTITNSSFRPQNVLSHSVVGIATGYGLDDQEVGDQVPVRARIFCTLCCPDRLWDLPSLLSNGYPGLLSRGLSGRAVKLTSHLQLVPRSRKHRLYVYTHSSMRIHGVLLNNLRTGTKYLFLTLQRAIIS
jgi:hypothetical protein